MQYFFASSFISDFQCGKQSHNVNVHPDLVRLLLTCIATYIEYILSVLHVLHGGVKVKMVEMLHTLHRAKEVLIQVIE